VYSYVVVLSAGYHGAWRVRKCALCFMCLLWYSWEWPVQLDGFDTLHAWYICTYVICYTYICTYIHIYICTYICHVCQSMFACVGEVIRTKWYVRLVFHCKAISFHSSRLCSLLLCIGGLWLLWCCMHCLAQVHKDMRVYTCYCVQCQPHCEVCTGLGSVGGLCCCFVADVETVRCVW